MDSKLLRDLADTQDEVAALRGYRDTIQNTPPRGGNFNVKISWEWAGGGKGYDILRGTIAGLVDARLPAMIDEALALAEGKEKAARDAVEASFRPAPPAAPVAADPAPAPIEELGDSVGDAVADLEAPEAIAPEQVDAMTARAEAVANGPRDFVFGEGGYNGSVDSIRDIYADPNRSDAS